MGRLRSSDIMKDPVYNLSDLNWQDDVLETGIGDIDGSDPTMKGYNKGYQMDPYKERFYAGKIAAKEVIDISHSVENYANEILSLWAEADGPLQNFFEAFTMNKFDNDMVKQIAQVIREQGYVVYPVLVDRRVRYARNTDIQPFVDYQLSDQSLDAIENTMNGQSDPIYNGPGRNEEYTDRSDDIGVPPNQYETTLGGKLKKKLIIADQIENIPYHEVMDAISEASKNVSILLNRKLQVAPVFIKSVRKQEATSAVPKDQNQYSNANVVNIITTYEIWRIFLEYDKTNLDDCFIIISGDYTLQGYKNGIWSNVKYCGFYSLLEEAENEIMGYLK